MRIFVLVMMVLFLLEMFGALFMLGTGKINTRTPKMLAYLVGVDVCMIIWAAALLV